MSDNSAWDVFRGNPERGDGHPLGARYPPIGSLHEQNEIEHICSQIGIDQRRTRREFAILDQEES